MKRILIPIVSALALLLAATSISTARSTHRASAQCPPARAHILIADEQAQVYDEHYSEEIYGCTYRPTRSRDLGAIPKFSSQGGEGIELLRLAGTVVAYEETLINLLEPQGEWAHYLIVVRNLQTGQVLHRIPTGTYEGPEPQLNIGIGPALAITVKSNGSVAWIAENDQKSTKSAPYDELHAIDKSGYRTIAVGKEISPKSLALTGSTLYWTQGGKAMSASLE
jgi:hypothetical protein